MIGKRGTYIVLGPNYIQSIDRNMKLRQYSIEVYGTINTYFRYVPQIYIEVSATTAVSVAKIYLQTLEVVAIQPQYLWADRGTET